MVGYCGTILLHHLINCTASIVESLHCSSIVPQYTQMLVYLVYKWTVSLCILLYNVILAISVTHRVTSANGDVA